MYQFSQPNPPVYPPQNPAYPPPSFPYEAPTGSFYGSSGYSSSSTNPYSVPVTPSTTGFPQYPLPPRADISPDSATYRLGSPIQDKAYPPRSMLELISYGPPSGEENTQVTVKVNADFPYTPDPNAPQQDFNNPPPPPPPKTLRILFGQTPVPTKVANISPVKLQDGGERFEGLTMFADAPHPSVTGFMPPGASHVENLSVPVYAQVLDASGKVLETKTVGHFGYAPLSATSRLQPPGGQFASPNPSPRNLKRPGDPLESDRVSPSPGAAGSMLRRGYSETSPYMPGQSPDVPSTSHLSRPQFPTRYASSGSYQPEPSPVPQYGAYNSPVHHTHQDWQQPPHHDPSMMHSPYGMRPPQPTPVQHPMNESPSSASGSPMPSNGSQPSLMRTSQLSGAPGSSPYNSYGGSNNKAALVLQQDLNLMAVGWNQEEFNAKRRLVQFWRRQDGPVIHAAFRAISQAEYVPNSIVISCIYREDKNECFVTSVDAIYLLEALVGVRFSVEEKNRIRRNLEGFRPITVSKAKHGAEDFFKLVMSFPNPKPRNIEKDVKVFPWKIFGTALKKIIGKYSASYVYPPNGNMGPGQPAAPERNPSPPVAPFTIPAPLMPAPVDGAPSSGQPSYSSYGNGNAQPADRNSFHLDPNEIFVGNPTGSSHHVPGIPPTPAATTPSYQTLSSSSSSSLPTIHHPGGSSEPHIHHSGSSSSIRHSPLPMDGPSMVYPTNMMGKEDPYARDGMPRHQYEAQTMYR